MRYRLKNKTPGKDRFAHTILSGALMDHGQILISAFLVLFFVCIFCFQSAASNHQIESGIPFIKNFSSGDYQAHTQNFDIIQDDRGIFYIANFAGILEYDGVSWRLILTDQISKVTTLCKDSTGRIFVGTRGEIGWLAPGKTGLMQFYSLTDLIDPSEQDFTEIIESFSTEEGIYFISHNTIYLYNNDKITTWHTERNIQSAYLVNRTIYCKITNADFVYLDEGELYPYEAFGVLPDVTEINFVLPFKNRELLIGTTNQGIFHFRNDTIKQFLTEIDQQLREFHISCGIKLNDNTYAIGTGKNGIFILNPDGSIKQVINRAVGLINNNVHNLYIARDQSLWLSLNNGIAQIDIHSPFGIFDEHNGLEGSVTDITRLGGLLFVSTYQGLFYYDQNDRRFVNFPEINTACWSIVPYKNSLIAGTSNGIYEIRNLKPSLITRGFTLKLCKSARGKDLIYAGQTGGIITLQKINTGWQIQSINQIKEEVWEIVEDSIGNVWLNTNSHGIIGWKPENRNQITYYNKESGLPGLLGNHLNKLNSNLAVTTVEGSFGYNQSSNSFEPISIFLDDTLHRYDWLFSIVEDENRNLWTTLGNQTGITYHKMSSGEMYSSYQTPFFPISDQIFWKIYPENKIVFFGGPDGLIRYNTSIELNWIESFNAIIRKVTIKNDSLIFAGEQIGNTKQDINNENPPTIKYNDNIIQFYFSSNSFPVKGTNEYSYFLEGFDQGWSDWGEVARKEYTSLPHGYYTFKVLSKNEFNRISAEASYSFYISTPWFLKWWAVILYVLIFIMLIYIVVRLRSKQLLREKERLEGIVTERTAEVVSQKEEIERSSLALTSKNEELIEINKVVKSVNEDLQQTLNDLKQTQTKLIQSEKLASLGQLTAGIAHEIQNPLNFVNNFSALSLELTTELREIIDEAKERLGEDTEADIEDVLEMIEGNVIKINEHGKRAERIVKGMLQHSRGKSGEFIETDINQLVEEYVNLAYHGKRAENKEFNATFTKKLDPEAGNIWVVPQDMSRVILNIVNNACYAVLEKSQKIKEGYKPEITIMTQRIDGKIEIRIRDNGTGMPEKVIAKIYEPFFTTKPTGMGTGLGLSMTYDIVTQIHGGTLEVSSKEDEFTEFKIVIPDRGK